jgi:hypothetical protein
LGRTPPPEEAQVHEKLVDTPIHRSRNDHVRDDGATSEENILTTIPDGYKTDFQDKTSDMLISEMVPVDQSVTNWTEMVTVQILRAESDTGTIQNRHRQGRHAFMSRPLTPPLRDPD